MSMAQKQKPSTLVSIVAGGVAGASETIVTYPAEFIKTRRQLPSSTVKPPNSLTIIRTVLSTHGLRGLYSGCTALALSNAAKSGIRFFSFETARSHLPTIFPSLASSNNTLLNVYAGLCAGVAESVLVVTPGEAVKTQIIHAAASNDSTARRSLPQTVLHVLSKEGPAAFWRGLAPVMFKQGTNSAVRFATFGAFRDHLSSLPTLRENVGTSGTTFLAGAGSGIVTVYASMPFDNIKTRMQSIGSERGMVKTVRKMLREEGVGVFWKATTPRLVRLTLSSSITFTVYDWVVKGVEVVKGDGTELGKGASALL